MHVLRPHHLVYLLMPLAIVLAFAWAPAAEVLGETSRIIYFHVPVSWISVLAFAVAGVCAVLYLKKTHDPLRETRFHNSMLIGTGAALLATVSGSMWARLMWGSYWNWDPRETSIVALLLACGAYLALRASLEHNPSRGRISAAYLVVAMTAMPFFVFVVPRIYPSLHPDPLINPDMKVRLDGEMRAALACSVIAFTLLYGYIFSIMQRISRITITLEERDDEE
jgi:heme exporter protein C